MHTGEDSEVSLYGYVTATPSCTQMVFQYSKKAPELKQWSMRDMANDMANA